MSAQGYDVVIVGAGVVGAVLARQLGARGKRVLVLDSGPGFKQGTTREAYLEAFYKAVAKVPDSPYPDSPYAPSARVLQVDSYGRRASDGALVLRPGQASYLDQQGPLPFSSTYERLVGGTMWHWLGTSLRLLPHDFKTNTLYGRGQDWPIDYEDIADYYARAEYLIGVAADAKDQEYHGVTFAPGYDYPMEAIPPSLTDRFVASRVDGLNIDGQTIRVSGTPAGRNGRPRGDYDNGRRTCAGNTSCVPICPIQAKYDPTVTLAEAMQTGRVTLLERAVATSVSVDPASGRVTGIDYARYDDAIGVTERGRAAGTLFVIAAHAIETAKLLLMSPSPDGKGVANSSDQVGRNLMDHPVMNSWALLPEAVYPFRGPISTSGIESLRDGPFRKHRSAFRIEIHNLGWNWPKGTPYSSVDTLADNGVFGSALRSELGATVPRQIDMNFLIEQEPQQSNRVTLSTRYRDALGLPHPAIHYDFNEVDKRGFLAAFDTARTLYEAMGADNRTDFAETPQDGLYPANYFRVNTEDGERPFLFQGAGHIAGTVRMGNDRKTSVVDRNLRAWDHDNLFMAGSGVFPTIGTANPTLTITALALRLADTLVGELDQAQNINIMSNGREG